MEFQFHIPTAVYFGKGCIAEHSAEFSGLGAKALLVTGRHSARVSGALGGVEEALRREGIEWMQFDGVENNPSLKTVQEAGKTAREFGADFVVGIGGGSAVDAAKAVAVLAAGEVSADDLFANRYAAVLPIAAVPTTSGTGSEATPYSVLLCPEKETKLSFGSAKTFPRCAFLDPSYTDSLGRESTVNTAVDAFTHLFESYCSKRSTPLSACLALEGLGSFGACLPALLGDSVGERERELLMYASLLGGAAIAQTGVTIAHGMGYCYTYFHGIPHGKANGLLMKPYLAYVSGLLPEKTRTALSVLHMESAAELAGAIEKLVGKAPVLSAGTIEKYTELTLLQKGSIANTAGIVGPEEISAFWKAAQEGAAE